MKKLFTFISLIISTASFCMQPNEANEIKALQKMINWCAKYNSKYDPKIYMKKTTVYFGGKCLSEEGYRQYCELDKSLNENCTKSKNRLEEIFKKSPSDKE